MNFSQLSNEWKHNSFRSNIDNSDAGMTDFYYKTLLLNEVYPSYIHIRNDSIEMKDQFYITFTNDEIEDCFCEFYGYGNTKFFFGTAEEAMKYVDNFLNKYHKLKVFI